MYRWLEIHSSCRSILVGGLTTVLFAVGCTGSTETMSTGQTANDSYSSYGSSDANISFIDEVETNANLDKGVFDLKFMDRNGKEVNLREFQGKKNVVLVVTRGFAKFFCPFCSAQTSRLVRNHDEFEKRNAKVIVVFPGDTSKVGEFSEIVGEQSGKSPAELPLAIVMDEKLAAVNQLSIQGDLAKPSTFILDVDGNVRFAYVGRSASDRPSLKAMFSKLDMINESAL